MIIDDEEEYTSSNNLDIEQRRQLDQMRRSLYGLQKNVINTSAAATGMTASSVPV